MKISFSNLILYSTLENLILESHSLLDSRKSHSQISFITTTLESHSNLIQIDLGQSKWILRQLSDLDRSVEMVALLIGTPPCVTGLDLGQQLHGSNASRVTVIAEPNYVQIDWYARLS